MHIVQKVTQSKEYWGLQIGQGNKKRVTVLSYLAVPMMNVATSHSKNQHEIQLLYYRDTANKICERKHAARK